MAQTTTRINFSIPMDLVVQMKELEAQCGRVNWSKVITEHLRHYVVEHQARYDEMMRLAQLD